MNDTTHTARETLGFQADLAHTYLYLLGYNAPEHALVNPQAYAGTYQFHK